MRTTARALAAGAALAVLAGCTAAPVPPPAAPPEAWKPVAAAEPIDPDTAYVDAVLADLTTAERAASVIMVHLGGTDGQAIRGTIDATGIAGVIMMGDNTARSVDVARSVTSVLASDPALPPLTAIDQEGGIVARLPDAGPSARALAAAPPEASREAFAARAGLVASAGIDVNFGIVADVTGDPSSFLAPRVFGGDPASVADRVAQAVAGERGVVFSTLKHFPGHGAAPGDSHSVIPQTPMSLDEWRAGHAAPFAAGIDAGAELVMLGHLRYTAVDQAPASLSPAWYGVLREELDFDGVAVTDDLSMLQASGEPSLADPYANGVAALAAGADLLLFVGSVDPLVLRDRLVAAVESGAIPSARLDEAAHRVLALRRAASDSDAPYQRCGTACERAVS